MVVKYILWNEMCICDYVYNLFLFYTIGSNNSWINLIHINVHKIIKD